MVELIIKNRLDVFKDLHVFLVNVILEDVVVLETLLHYFDIKGHDSDIALSYKSRHVLLIGTE
jgi:hypothetical protein